MKFKELSKNDKIFRVINLIFMTLQALACLGLAIYYICIDDPDNRLMASFGMFIAVLLPFLYELAFRVRLSNIVFFFIQLYALVAGVIGSVLNVYYLVSWYDIFVHTLAGYVFAVFGIFVFSRMENYSKLKKWTIVVFCFCFTMTCELIWELFEWASDNLLGQTAQGLPPEGFDVPLVTDTMVDILCNFIGGIVFCTQYLLGKTLKCSFGIKLYERELVPQEKVSTKQLPVSDTLETENLPAEEIKQEGKE